MNTDKTNKMIITHYKKYPKLQMQDIFKYLYQSSYGCEHMVSSVETVVNYILKEYENLSFENKIETDALDGEYCRVNLSYLNTGLSANTLGKLFYLSAQKEADAKEKLINKISVVQKLICEKLLPFTKDEFEIAVKEWEDRGFTPVHHSDIFRQTYKPSYRVIANKFEPFLPLFAKIDKLLEKGMVNIAIEGGSASGKTTLSEILGSVYNCNVFHMDDFFLQPHQRTPQRYAQTGGNIDYERFLKEVLKPLKNRETINYRKFDCMSMQLKEPAAVEPKKLNVIEGAYSMHPELEKYYDFSVFLEISPQKQKERILKRNSPQEANRFFNEWIPLENVYFSNTNVKERCSIIIDSE